MKTKFGVLPRFVLSEHRIDLVRGIPRGQQAVMAEEQREERTTERSFVRQDGPQSRAKVVILLFLTPGATVIYSLKQSTM